MELVYTVLLAILPTAILSYFVYKKDVFEKEPVSLLVTLFFSGVLATVPATVTELLLIKLFDNITNVNLHSFLVGFIGVALVEELYKALFVYKKGYNNKAFNYMYDGIVYAVFTSLGFATLENILYVLKYGQSAALLRALVSVPAHAFFGVSMGYYMGKAKLMKRIGNKVREKRYIIVSLIIPIIFHGFFDFLLLTENENALIIFFAFVAFLYIIAYKQIKKHSNKAIVLND